MVCNRFIPFSRGRGDLLLEPIPAVSRWRQGTPRTSPQLIAGPSGACSRGSVRACSSARHGEPGFKPATFRSLADLLCSELQLGLAKGLNIEMHRSSFSGSRRAILFNVWISSLFLRRIVSLGGWFSISKNAWCVWERALFRLNLWVVWYKKELVHAQEVVVSVWQLYQNVLWGQWLLSVSVCVHKDHTLKLKKDK